MSSNKFEIRWINDAKRHGLFATENIDAGIQIYEEPAVIVNLSNLDKLVHHLRAEENKNKTTIPKTLRRNTKVLTQKIQSGMQDMQEIVRDDPDYSTATRIHEARLDSDKIEDPDVEDPRILDHRPWVPMELYLQVLNIKPTESDDDQTILAKEDLQLINTFLTGSHESKGGHIWTPHSRFLNHGCKPRAMLSCVEHPSSDDESIGVATLRSLVSIRKNEEITIEYYGAIGPFGMRRQALRWKGIAECSCAHCNEEDDIAQQAENGDDAAKEANRHHNERGIALHKLMVTHPLNPESHRPADFYQSFLLASGLLNDDDYRGNQIPMLYAAFAVFAKKYNDNIRLYYISNFLLRNAAIAYKTSQEGYRYAKDQYYASLEGKLWNEQSAYKDYLNICPLEFDIDDRDHELICMIDQDPASSTYHLLTITPAGGPAPISFEENRALVRRELARRGKEDEEKAEAAAVALMKEEDEEAAKKEKGATKRRQKKEKQKEKKKAAAATIEAAAEEEAEIERVKWEKESAALDAIVAAVKEVEEHEKRKRAAEKAAMDAAIAVAMKEEEKERKQREEEEAVAAAAAAVAQAKEEEDPTNVAVADPPPSRPPRLHLSPSCPELAVVARWLANAPLQPPTTGEGEDWWSE